MDRIRLAVSVCLLLLTAGLCITLVVLLRPQPTAIDHVVYADQPVDAGEPCIRRWQLGWNHKMVSLCKHETSVIVDIRQFVRDKATRKGVWFGKDTWERFTLMIPDIDRAFLNSEPEEKVNYTLGNCSHQFDLDPFWKISVCWYAREARVDMRYFLEDKPTGIGIWLDGIEWTDLQLYLSRIRKGLGELIRVGESL